MIDISTNAGVSVGVGDGVIVGVGVRVGMSRSDWAKYDGRVDVACGAGCNMDAIAGDEDVSITTTVSATQNKPPNTTAASKPSGDFFFLASTFGTAGTPALSGVEGTLADISPARGKALRMLSFAKRESR